MSGGSLSRGRPGLGMRTAPPPAPPPPPEPASTKPTWLGVRESHRRPHFNPAFMEFLLSDDRKRFYPAEQILQQAGLTDGMMVVDLGCGPGYFTMPARRMAGDEGRVWAVDVQQPMLDHVYNRCQIGRIRGVRQVLSSERVVPLESAIADFVIMAWVLNEADYPADLVREAFRLLKPHGMVAVMEWHKQAKDVALPAERRLGPDDVAKLAANAKLFVHRTTDLSPEAYLTLLGVDEPPPPPPPPPEEERQERADVGPPRRSGIVMR